MSGKRKGRWGRDKSEQTPGTLQRWSGWLIGQMKGMGQNRWLEDNGIAQQERRRRDLSGLRDVESGCLGALM